ncbi:hypothetical protein GCM10010448_63970 [Streptomyces glomeratus]|uniref:Uncharacterized protein n=1 Tax=Streptomyces glomeratus TaxID=284452 RepID=A0ABP6M4K3_9ACTN
MRSSKVVRAMARSFPEAGVTADWADGVNDADGGGEGEKGHVGGAQRAGVGDGIRGV